jgi:hypothetical protein
MSKQIDFSGQAGLGLFGNIFTVFFGHFRGFWGFLAFFGVLAKSGCSGETHI